MADMNITEFDGAGIPVNFNYTTGGSLIGPRKLAQSWLKMFLTELGSQAYEPGTGTSFLQVMRDGLIRKATDVTFNFNNASTRIAKHLADDDITTALPLNEQLATTELEDFTILQEQSLLQLRIKLTTKAGTSIILGVPVSTT